MSLPLAHALLGWPLDASKRGNIEYLAELLEVLARGLHHYVAAVMSLDGHVFFGPLTFHWVGPEDAPSPVQAAAARYGVALPVKSKGGVPVYLSGPLADPTRFKNAVEAWDVCPLLQRELGRPPHFTSYLVLPLSMLSQWRFLPFHAFALVISPSPLT
jgi:hypothetical protein